jgi:hypothetical protein
MFEPIRQVWPPVKQSDLEPVAVSMDVAVALTGLSKPTIYCAAAEGVIKIYRDAGYRDDPRHLVVDYRDLLKVVHDLPRWTPPKKRTRKPSNESEIPPAA